MRVWYLITTSAVIFICAAIIFFSRQTMSTLEEQDVEWAYRDAETAARVFSSQVDGVFSELESALRSAAYVLKSDPSPDSLKTLFESGGLPRRALVQIAFADAAGRTRQTQIGPDPNLTSISDREHFRVHVNRDVDGVFVGKPVIGRVSRKWSIQVSMRVDNDDGSFRGVLVASADPFFFEKFWQPEVAGGAVAMELVGVDGVIRSQVTDATDTVLDTWDSRIGRLDIGPVAIDDLRVSFARFPVFQFWQLEREPALLIGMDALSRLKSLTVDYRRKVMVLAPREDRDAQAAAGD